MKRLSLLHVLLALLILITLPGCQAIMGLFRAGMVAGILVVIAVIVLVFFLIRALVTG